MKSPWLRAASLILVIGLGSFAGCGGGLEGNLPPEKPYDASNLKADQEKVKKAMGGMYKGAPGVPRSGMGR